MLNSMRGASWKCVVSCYPSQNPRLVMSTRGANASKKGWPVRIGCGGNVTSPNGYPDIMLD